MRSRLTFDRLSHQKETQLLTKLDGFSSFEETPGRYSPEFCWALAERRIVSQVNSVPKSGRIAALDAISYCNAERLKLSSKSRRDAFTCLTSTFLGLLATAERLLGNTSRAGDLLRRAAMISGDCFACGAENERRLGFHFQMIGDFVSSRVCIDRAAVLYDELGNDGHNLNWNGPAACLFASAHLRFLEGDYCTAVTEQRITLRKLNPIESLNLYGYSLHNLAVYLYKLGDDSYLPEAESCLDRAAQHFYGASLSLEAANTNWLRGMIKANLGNGRARSLLEKAYLQLRELGQWWDVMLIAADLAHFYLLCNSPWEIQHVLGVLRTQGGRGSWLNDIPSNGLPILDELANLSSAQTDNIRFLWNAICELRRVQGSESVMPCLLPPLRIIG
jgi:tetratricopeptide (TPR) repeat protein